MYGKCSDCALYIAVGEPPLFCFSTTEFEQRAISGCTIVQKLQDVEPDEIAQSRIFKKVTPD